MVSVGEDVDYLHGGEVVVFAKLAGFEIESNGVMYRLMKHTNILYIEQ